MNHSITHVFHEFMGSKQTQALFVLASCLDDSIGAPLPPLLPHMLHLLNTVMDEFVTVKPDEVALAQTPNWWRAIYVGDSFTTMAFRDMPSLCKVQCVGWPLVTKCVTQAGSRLREIDVFFARELSSSLPRPCPHLKVLTLRGLIASPSLARLLHSVASTLTTLRLEQVQKLTTLADWGSLPNLTALTLDETRLACEELVALATVAPGLQHLTLRNHLVDNLRWLRAGPRSIVSLELWPAFIGVEDIALLPTFAPVLQRLSIKECARLTSVQPLRISRSLRELDLSETAISAEGLMGISNIPALETLTLRRCLELHSVAALTGSVSLRTLRLDRSSVTSEGLRGLERIPTLTALSLVDVQTVTDVTCLSGSPSLQTIDLSQSAVTVDGVRGVDSIPTLRRLFLKDCCPGKEAPSFAPDSESHFVPLRGLEI